MEDFVQKAQFCGLIVNSGGTAPEIREILPFVYLGITLRCYLWNVFWFAKGWSKTEP
jgi:hypothetical protein